MANLVVAAVVLFVIGAAVAYIIKEKKKGTRCIGCPMAGQCARKCAGQCQGEEDTSTAYHAK
ncbi:MAG: FeoB-associated Cys-rich membrane protein [Lachnospiraceae bacterium]|nr:FeoB-associated Cys-rich membrane protein [Lachnospiraceae bacterium]